MADASANTTISNSQGKKFWKTISDDPESGVTVVNKKLHLVIPPYYLDELKTSVTSVIDCRLIRYQKELGGILAGYGNLVIKSPKADLLFDLCNIHIDVEGDFYIFNPEVNKELTGIVNKKSIDHIGCLVHGLFNISLPKPFNSEDWPGKPARPKDKVRFCITKVDLLSVVPYIEGRIIELIPNLESDSEVRQRTSSDSGVSIASEESMNIVITPEANMDRKKSKLSLSQKKKTPPTVAVEVKNELKEEDKKRKRNISEGSSIQETPRNKRARPSDNRTSETVSEDLAPVENLTTKLFKKISEKLDDSTTPSHKQKKKLDASTSVQATEKNEEPDMVIVPENVSQRLIKELSSSKSASKKRKMEEDGESQEPVKSPPKSISKQIFDFECERESSTDEDFKSSKKTPSSQNKSKPAKKTEVTSSKESSAVKDFKSPPKTPLQPKSAKKLNVDSDKGSSCSDQDFATSQKTPMSVKKTKLTKKMEVESEKDSNCSDQDFATSQKTPMSVKKTKLTKKMEVESEKESNCSDQDFATSQKTPMSVKKTKLTKKMDVESEKESNCSDEDFMSSQKTPVQVKKLSKKLNANLGKASSSDDFGSSPKIPSSQSKSKLTKSNDREELFVSTPAKKTPSKPVKESSCSDQDFATTQKTPMSVKKSKLTKKKDVESEKESSCSDQDFVTAQKTPVSVKKSKLAKKMDVESEKESSCSDQDFGSSQKIPSSQNKSKLIKSHEEEELFVTPAKKTPSKRVKEEKSKNSVKTNDAVTPGKQPKKKSAVVDSDPESDNEFLILELLNSSRLVSNSTPTSKTSKKKQTPSSKVKRVDAEKKSKTPLKSLSSQSSPMKEIETATPTKKNAKESLSGKSLKALASNEKQEAVESDQEVHSPKKTTKTSTSSKKPLKAASPERLSNVSLNEKTIKVEPAKKRTKLKKDAGKEANSDNEDILAEILKTVQPKEKKSKSRTKNPAN